MKENEGEKKGENKEKEKIIGGRKKGRKNKQGGGQWKENGGEGK